MLSVAPSFVINPTLNPKTPFDPVTDFAPVTLMCATPTVIVAHPSLGARNVKELIALLKANPGKFSYSSAGTGTPGASRRRAVQGATTASTSSMCRSPAAARR